MIGKNVENKDYKKEKRIIEKMKEGIRNPNLCAKDWEEFYKKVFQQLLIFYVLAIRI